MPAPADVPADRGPLDVAALQTELRRRGSRWPPFRVVSTVESTNADVAALARDGAAEGNVLIAEGQTSGRGRLERSWVSPRGSGLTLSVLLRPKSPTLTWSWLPIVAGLALLTAVRRLTDLDAVLKWPNDLLLGPAQAKGAGILAQSGPGWVVIGMGLNVSTTAEELPSGATSLRVEGATVGREALFVELVLALESGYAAWSEANGDAERSGVLADYVDSCATLSRSVTVQLPDGGAVRGVAEGIDSSGGLTVRTEDGSLTTVVAADVVHVRPR